MKDKALQKVLVIGSGPTVVGRSSEYDYATVQACLALKEESIEVIVLNPNSASIHTEKEYADRIYIEPITIETLRKVIQIEKPDVVLASFAGLGVLDLINQAGISGVFSENNVELLAFDWEVIGKTASSKNLK
ncbi:MAG TPA: carbamoyl-phosphate synthase large subunit, partial [Clostridiales bacterium]|nr:carbamoyl-phosphate synthase large subunit [Clostridiales bacterium]